MELRQHRSRAIGMGGALVVHALVLAALLWFASGPSRTPEPSATQFVAVDLTRPPPPPPPAPPPPDAIEEAAAAPPSRGNTAAPARPVPILALPLATPTPVPPSLDPGSAAASGLGGSPGAGAGAGGNGSGTGAGDGGEGRGAGLITPPMRIAGGLTHEDYRRADPPRGAGGTVAVEFRVRSDGAVDRCRVRGSSGYDVFDTMTCRLIEQRFRFRPARDEDGMPLDWQLRTEFTWAPR